MNILRTFVNVLTAFSIFNKCDIIDFLNSSLLTIVLMLPVNITLK